MKTQSKNYSKKVFSLVCGGAAVMLMTGTISLIISQPASAKPEFAASTGRPCGACHANPSGGGKLKPLGEKFKANGFKLK